MGVRVTGLRELIGDLRAVSVDVADLRQAFGGIANEAAGLAAAFAPRRSGRLASSIRGTATRNKATVTAGRGIAYAGVINYGWPARGIAASGFMQRADAAISRTAPRDLERQLHRLLAIKGLT